MQIVELAAKLQSVGFSDKQAKVYVAALFLGPSAVQKIAEQAEINRATAYVILDELATMGLVSESTEGKKTVFVAEPPAAITRYLEAQAKALETKKDELKSLLPDLAQTSRATDGEDAPMVRFYKGLKGSEQLSRELLRKAKKGETIYSVINYDEAVKADPTVSAGKTRVRKGINVEVLFSSDEKHDFKVNRKELISKVVQVDKDFTAEINLYPTRASFITYACDKSVGVLIDSPKIVETLRQVFELAAKNSRQ